MVTTLADLTVWQRSAVVCCLVRTICHASAQRSVLLHEQGRYLPGPILGAASW